MGKNAIIKFGVTSEMKEEADKLCKNALGLKLCEGYPSIFLLGIETLSDELLKNSVIRVEHLVEKRMKKIYFQENDK